MNHEPKHIKIILPFDSNNFLEIYSEHVNQADLREISLLEAEENGESPYQLMEGCSYEYFFSDERYSFKKEKGIVRPSIKKTSQGRLTPNTNVGMLSLAIIDKENPKFSEEIILEIRSIKASYRTDYRFMLAAITEKCTELILQANAPIKQNLEVDFNQNAAIDYQRFAFIQSIINSIEFDEAIHRITSSPNTNWTNKIEKTDSSRIKRITNTSLKQLLRGNNKLKLSAQHPLAKKGIKNIAAKIDFAKKIDTVDTPENRFIKHALSSFLLLCTSISSKTPKTSRLHKEAKVVALNLSKHLSHTVFKEIGRPQTLKLNSPILQKKEGYRAILRAWLMFDLAGKLTWQGGEDVYGGGKRNVAVLYEYWLFFTLLDLMNEVFEIESKNINELIKPTSDGLGLQLKQGKFTALQGTYNNGGRELNIKFNYNKSFSGNAVYPKAGSWTKSMRPDYTLSIYPKGVKETEAEEQELIVHIHFDAKYKIEHLKDIINQESDIDEEKQAESRGKFKNIDLLKMHAYKDAIRRTGGAYVLYPGSELPYEKRGFHELTPGLGAFPIRPSKNNNGVADLKRFIQDVLQQFLNRASQRENLAYRVYDIHKDEPNNIVRERIPETYGINRDLIPSEINVLVGFFKEEVHYSWISKKGLYNIRVDSRHGSIPLTAKEITPRYILLHTKKDQSSDELWEVIGKGPKIYTKEKMNKEGYPYPTENSYLIYEVKKADLSDFNNAKWNFKELSKYESYRQSAVPFSVSLAELMQVVV